MRPLLASLCLSAVLCPTALAVAGCGDDDPADRPSAEPSSTSAAPTPSASATSEPMPARDACRVLRPADVGRALGTRVERVVAERGCRFANPDDPSATSLGISQAELAAVGGIDGARTGVRAVVEGEVEDVAGVGDEAFVVVGPAFGGSTPTGGGGVVLGSSLVQVTVIPGGETAADDVRATTVDVLALIAEKARP